MVYKLRPAKEVQSDLDLIEDHLVQTYVGFGDALESAVDRALSRIKGALDYLDGLSEHPHRGTEHPKMRPGLGTVTANRFIYYFEIDEALSEVRILAIFFGGLDHRAQIMERLHH